MRTILTTCFVALIISVLSMKVADKPKPVIIGYIGGYKGLVKADRINAEKLTHINYAFVNVQNNRAVLTNLRTDSTNFRNLVLLKKKNPDLKILISIGGWSWSENFSDAVLTDTSRQAFAASAAGIIRKYQLDGVDIDWEYPDMQGEQGNIHRPEDKQNFTLMFEALRKELDVLEKETGKHKLLTTAVGGFESFLDHSEMGKAQQYLDYINLMTYDYYYSSIAGHHTNLYASKLYKSSNDADKAIRSYIAAGVPAGKLVMGVAFYGKTSKLKEGAQKGIGDAMLSHSFGKGYTFIKDSLVNKKGFTAYRDKAAKAPYLFNASTLQFMTYDDEWSVKNKCKYVLKHRMGGVMFWEYDSDPKEYLLDVMNDKLR
ncbi:glycoside hydrolase family 18 protein [Hufsiella ginkgonis]|uniref:chitinase n=1 Tax=Hufsiella ginkgonis TaxID=2695274 RepID=A0A7K1Y1A0_9SPHI|nr:glycoside hydrolase family 18 protein [Hufsiella ginkgonis]MXV16456.1 chitinase [Hufsiella ginkgonis]